MSKRTGVLLAILLLTVVVAGSAYAAPKAATTTTTKSSTLTVNVVRGDQGPFPSEDRCWVYLYKPDNVSGKQYDEVGETDELGNVTFTRVPAQQMILMVIPQDYFTTAEGYRQFQELPQWHTILTAEDLSFSATARVASPTLSVVYPY